MKAWCHEGVTLRQLCPKVAHIDFDKIAGRILFDTNLVNLTLDCGEFIFDGGTIPEKIPEKAIPDVEALKGLFDTGRRASWQLAISPLTYDEVVATTNPQRRRELLQWLDQLWLYWREFFKEDEALSDEHAHSLARRLVDSQYLAALPQRSDRILVAHAVAYGCDAFCTRDYKTILRRRDKLSAVGLRFLSPTEWWREVEPWSRIWC